MDAVDRGAGVSGGRHVELEGHYVFTVKMHGHARGDVVYVEPAHRAAIEPLIESAFLIPLWHEDVAADDPQE